MSEIVETKEMLELETYDSVSVGGKVGNDGQLKNVNFHRINRALDRQVAYDITRSILELQVEPINNLRRVENYSIY